MRNNIGFISKVYLIILALAAINSCCNVCDAQNVVAWGGSVYNADSSIPAGITNPIAIAAGDYHNLILQADGTVIACGTNLYNQANVPADLTNTIAVAAGYYFNLALRSDQTVEAWGRNSDGQTAVPSCATNV